MSTRNSHLIVVGSGIAGLYGSLLAAESGLRVTLVTKGALAQSNTHFAQGGICAVLGSGDAAPGDSVEAHIADTLKAGAGECDPEAVRVLCTEAVTEIAALERFGVVFDRDGSTGLRSLGLEGAHSAARILHAGGDATGAAIADGLILAVRDAAALGTITILDHTFVHELLLEGGRVTGVQVQGANGAQSKLSGDAVLLASGGAGQLFDYTTNPSVATGDGVALAWRAGAVVADLEYFQFHPTALAVGENFLISEAVRGAGAVLRDSTGFHFMPQYHVEGDLAPRDVVSRSIMDHLHSLGAGPGETVFLDATGLEATHGAGYLARRFPTIDAATKKLGFDWRTQWLPVTPAAHYWMGGVVTDLNAQTTLLGLFAAGEVTCTGVHGANRLASNSLLEGLVFGRRAVESFLATGGRAEIAKGTRTLSLSNTQQVGAGAPVPSLPLSRESLQQTMGLHAGVVRNGTGLEAAAAQLAAWRSEQNAGTNSTNSKNNPNSHESTSAPFEAAELENLLLVAELLVRAALERKNSIGAHYRSDFPLPPSAIGTVRDRASWVSASHQEAAQPSGSLNELESESV